MTFISYKGRAIKVFKMHSMFQGVWRWLEPKAIWRGKFILLVTLKVQSRQKRLEGGIGTPQFSNLVFNKVDNFFLWAIYLRTAQVASS